MNALPDPELRSVYRLDAELDAPVDLGDTRRATGGSFRSPAATQRAPTSTQSCCPLAAPTGRSSMRPGARSPTSATR
jgi:hypothetical protein